MISPYRVAYKNYLYVLFKMYTRRKVSSYQNVNIRIRTRNGTKLVFPYNWVKYYATMCGLKNKNNNDYVSELNINEEGISFKYKNRYVTIDPARFSDPYAVFLNEEYSYLEVKSKDVIDVGANIGDSPIYFALNGANRVIGLEPYPYAFQVAEKNVKLNKIDNIVLLNAGYGKDSEIVVDPEKISGGGSSLVSSVKGKSIPIFSLRTLINKFNIKEGILKMDCEGCEYAMLDENDETFNYLEMIQIEYHYGYEDLVEKLKNCGFDVKFTEPKKSYNPQAENPNMSVGYIYATRRVQ